MRYAVPTTQKRPFQVEIHGEIPHRKIDLGDFFVCGDGAACAIEQHIKFAIFRSGGVDACLDAGVVCDIGLKKSGVTARRANFGLTRLAQFFVQLKYPDPGPFAGENICRRARNAGTRAGDRCNFAFQSPHGPVSLFYCLFRFSTGRSAA